MCILRIQVIGPEEIFKELETQKTPTNVSIISQVGENGVYKKLSELNSRIYVLDYHSLTVEMIDFEPDIIIIVPFVYSAQDLQIFGYSEEYLEALTLEMYTHISDTNDVIKAKIEIIEFPIDTQLEVHLKKTFDIVKNYASMSILQFQGIQELSKYIESM